jgi:hypothetical protein
MKKHLTRLLNRRHILQFSLPRSGSTLVYNLTREILPGYTLEKCHTLDRRQLDTTIISTYRNPVDIVASFLLCENHVITDANLRKQSLTLHQQGLCDLLGLRGRDNLVLLRYESFVNGFAPIFDAVSQRFGIEILPAQRQALTQKYSRESVSALTEKFSDFSCYDRTTQFHGRNISRFGGEPSFSAQVFSREQWEQVASYFTLFMLEMDYPLTYPEFGETVRVSPA